MKMLRVASLAALCAVASTAGAVDMDIEAEFTPDATNPGANRFVNKTESTGYCAIYPSQCTGNRFSLLVPIETEFAAIDAGARIENGAMIRVSNEPKTVEVVAEDGSLAQLTFTITHFGANYNTSPSVQTITGIPDNGLAHRGLWEGADWVNPAPECGYVGVGFLTPTRYTFFWTNRTGTACGKVARFPIPSFNFNNFNIAYELATPNPLTMSNGTYTGSVTYTVGPGGDIDFGNRLQANDDTLTFNFTLKVNHILNISFPAGAHRLTLNPPGGWRHWLASRQVPDKLIAHQDFRIWSSGQFKMQLNCEYSAGEGCAIENKDGDRVALTTRVTLPSGLTGPAGPVKETPLSETTPLLIDSTHYVDNGRARLDFEVAHAGVEQMTGNAGTKYSGNVTVIWDGQI